MAVYKEQSNLIWQIADLLRGTYRPPQYERVILPMTVLRRFDCVLAPTKAKVVAEYNKRRISKGAGYSDAALDVVLNRAAGQLFHNRSELTFETLTRGHYQDADQLDRYINGFSANVRSIFEYFEFANEIQKMREGKILDPILHSFAQVDLRPERVPNNEMGLLFEELVRRFNEFSNETADESFTPREVIRLMVNLLFRRDDVSFLMPGMVRRLLDPVCGTGGMLAEAQKYFREHHPDVKLDVFGQDYNKRACAIAASDMLLKQVDDRGGDDNIRLGDIFADDCFKEKPLNTFDFLIADPPFGLDWKRQQWQIRDEHEQRGMDGRFGAGLPRVSDGSLLFLQHMISKFNPVLSKQQNYGSRLAIVLGGSPLSTGGAGSGESNIRKWIIENDWLEAIIALPEQMFYNTGIGAYIWIVTNSKEKRRQGKIQLIDARRQYVTLRRSLGNKRRKIGEGTDGESDQLASIVNEYTRFRETGTCKILDNEHFRYERVTDEFPLRLVYQMTVEDKSRFLNACPELLDDVQAIDKDLGRDLWNDWNIVRVRVLSLLQERDSKWTAPVHRLFRDVFTRVDPEAVPVRSLKKGELFESDPHLREFKNSPINSNSEAAGYEINFNRYFYPYQYTPTRQIDEIDADLDKIIKSIESLAWEQRAILTSGLDRGVPVRHSGIPWLGQIPAHWTVVLLKEVAEVRGGLKLGKDYGSRQPWSLTSYPYLRVANVQDGYLDLSSVATVMIPEDEAKSYVLRPGDVLMNQGGDADKLGRGCIWRGEINGCLHQNHVFVVRHHSAGHVRALPSWLNLWRSFDGVRSYFASHAKRSTNLASISMSYVRELPVLLPPEDEQLAIAAFVERHAEKMDMLSSAAKRAMVLSSERRAAIVTAAVSGQLRGRSDDR
jgi:type I restriction enzyme M protein